MRKIRQNSIRLCPSMLFTVDDDTDVRINIQCKFGDNCHSEHSRERYMQCKEPDLGSYWIIALLWRGIIALLCLLSVNEGKVGTSAVFPQSHTN